MWCAVSFKQIIAVLAIVVTKTESFKYRYIVKYWSYVWQYCVNADTLSSVSSLIVPGVFIQITCIPERAKEERKLEMGETMTLKGTLTEYFQCYAQMS